MRNKIRMSRKIFHTTTRSVQLRYRLSAVIVTDVYALHWQHQHHDTCVFSDGEDGTWM